MKTDNQTYYNLRITTADNQVSVEEYVTEKQTQKIKDEAIKLNSTVEELKVQTFGVSIAESIDEILELVPNPKVALSYFNYGLTLEEHGVKRTLMRDPGWAPIEGVFDLLPHVQEEKEGRMADPLSKARRGLRELWANTHPGQELPTDAEIDAVLQGFAGAAVAV